MKDKLVESQQDKEFTQMLSCGQATMHGVLDFHVAHIMSLIKANEECFILRWMEQNPDELLNNWEMCHRHDRFGENIETVFYMRKKESYNG